MLRTLVTTLLLLSTLFACTGVESDEPGTSSCDGKCDGWGDGGPAWRSVDQLDAEEAAVVRADLAALPTAIELTTWKLHREDVDGIRVYWSMASSPTTFAGARRKMTARTAQSLIAARTLYRARGFSIPAAIRVYIVEADTMSKVANGAVVLGHDAIDLDFPASLVASVEAGGDPLGADTTTPAHELFHVAQGAFATNKDADGNWLWDPSNRWLLESTAVFMEDEVFDAEDAWVEQYREWNQTLPLFGLGCAGVCTHEWYQRVLFFKYLETVGAMRDMKAFLQYLLAGADPTKPQTLTPQLDAFLGGRLMSHWLRFIALYSIPELRTDALSSELASVPITFDAPVVRITAGTGAITAFSGDLWQLGGARAVTLDVDPSLAGHSLLVRAAVDGGSPFLATVLDSDGHSFGELTPASPTLSLAMQARLHVAIVNTDPTHHAVATLSVEPQ